MTRLSHRKILFLLIITPLLLFIELAVGFAVFTSIQNMNTVEKKNNKLDTYLRTNSRYVSIAESAQRGYLLTGDHKFKENFLLCLDEIKKNEEYYDTLQNDIKSDSIERIQGISDRKFAEMQESIRLYDAGQEDSSLALVKTGKGKMMMDSIRSTTTALRDQINAQITHEREREKNLFIFFFGLIAIMIVFNLFLVQYTYKQFSSYTEKLESMVNSLEDANERMSQYTSVSYHELKTPLRNIHGFAQLLKVRYADANPDSEEGQFAQYITDGIRQMNQTIDDMRAKYLDSSVNDKSKLN